MRLLSMFFPLCAAVVLAGCVQTTSPTATAEGYRQIAAGIGQVVGRTKADEKIAQLTAYCTELQIVAAVGSMFVPEKQRKAAEIAQAALYAVCSKPPRDVGSALVAAVDAVEAVKAVQTAP